MNKQIYSFQENQFAVLGKSTFSILHDLNSNLTSLKMNIELLSDKAQDKENKEIVEMFESSAQNMKELIESARYQVQNNELIEYINLKNEVEKLKKLMNLEMKHKNIIFWIDISSNLNVKIDKVRLNQILLNLIRNSIDAFEKVKNRKRKKIIIQAEKCKNSMKLKVIDNASGIDPKNFDKIFKCLYSTKKTQGSGMGLYLVKKIIKSLQGKIQVKSEKNQGTQFQIEIPLQQFDKKEITI